MKGLDNLIRLAKRHLDEKRRSLAELERLASDLDEQMKHLEEEVVAEQQAGSQGGLDTLGYDTYAIAVIERRATLTQSRASVEARLEAARDDLREKFQELKRYELTADTRRRQALALAAKREQAQLDEIALTGHRRRRAARAA